MLRTRDRIKPSGQSSIYEELRTEQKFHGEEDSHGEDRRYSGRRKFQAEKTASTKALRQEDASSL